MACFQPQYGIAACQHARRCSAIDVSISCQSVMPHCLSRLYMPSCHSAAAASTCQDITSHRAPGGTGSRHCMISKGRASYMYWYVCPMLLPSVNLLCAGSCRREGNCNREREWHRVSRSAGTSAGP
jgi:hypothetical protein